MNKKCVIAIIKGGLGNQLFIYASGLALARRTNRSLYLDHRRGYTHDKYERSYRLDRFAITAQEMPEEWRVAPTLKHFRHKLIRAWNKLLPRNYRNYLAQSWSLATTQLTELQPCRDKLTLNGYWSDEEFFIDCAVAVREELKVPQPKDPRNLSVAAELAGDNIVFLHARRNNYPTLLPIDYYRKAIADIKTKISDPEFVVFSDDHDWTRKHIDFGDSPVRWIEHNQDDELADLWLMTRCRHAIIANSSFSWWGAWLGGDLSEGRIIYAPENPQWNIRPAKGWHSISFEIGG